MIDAVDTIYLFTGLGQIFFNFKILQWLIEPDNNIKFVAVQHLRWAKEELILLF